MSSGNVQQLLTANEANSFMEKIIKAAVERGASDLHIKAGDVFRARINGKLVPRPNSGSRPIRRARSRSS